MTTAPNSKTQVWSSRKLTIDDDWPVQAAAQRRAVANGMCRDRGEFRDDGNVKVNREEHTPPARRPTGSRAVVRRFLVRCVALITIINSY